MHVSSDTMFSGSTERYDETSPPGPTTPYGAARLPLRRRSRASIPPPLSQGPRSSSETGTRNTRRTCTRSGPARQRVSCSPTTSAARVHLTDLASALLELARSPHSGIHYVTGADAVSRNEMGVLIARRDSLDEASRPTRPGRPAGAAGCAPGLHSDPVAAHHPASRRTRVPGYARCVARNPTPRHFAVSPRASLIETRRRVPGIADDAGGSRGYWRRQVPQPAVSNAASETWISTVTLADPKWLVMMSVPSNEPSRDQ